MYKFTFSLILFFTQFLTVAQEPESPTDYLSKEFHAGRREALRKLLPPNSMAVFFANPVRNRANDVDYHYHQDPDFYYLSGYREPNSVLVVFSEEQTNAQGEKYKDVIFVQKRDALKEQWNGKRLGKEGVKATLGFAQVFEGADFAGFPMNYKSFAKIFVQPFNNDVRNERDKADLFDLMAHFTAQTQALSTGDTKALDEKLASLREIKTQEELKLLRKAIDISAVGQIEVMKAMHPDMSEMEVQGLHEYVYKKYGAEYEGYPSIVGAGHNGCVLHYIENNRPKVGKQLVLMDLGAEYRAYTADVTRTIPATGKFSQEELAIYNLVYQAQDEAIKDCKVGANFWTPNKTAVTVLIKGLKELGIIQKDEQISLYLPHGVSHHLGLDVHDKSNYGNLQENMVITVEPGIYIPANSPCDKKWWGIAVRIEDDILITKDGFENLSSKAPRKAAEIEELMKKDSPLDKFVLPKLD